MQRGESFDGDVRGLRQDRPVTKRERPEREGPDPAPRFAPGTSAATETAPLDITPVAPGQSLPTPGNDFDGLDFNTWGNGHPPDTNGDVGPSYFIETINTAIGIFDKGTGGLVTVFSFNTFMSQGHFGNLCDTNNFGDPVVLYDTFEDRWVITDFAFQLDASGNVLNPPGAFECFAVSKTGDPVSGGWNFYSINTAGGLGDYPKLGIWPDGIYMSANMFQYAAAGSFLNPRVFAFNKAEMYAGAPTVQVVSFDAPAADFTILPSNARLQSGTPPAGTPNYFVSTWQLLNALTVYKFHVDWNRISLSTFTGPDMPIAATSWPNASVPNAPSLGGNSLDVLQIRAMMQNQYANIGGVESLWTTHTVRRANTSGFAAPRWYQTQVTGGTVAAAITQAATYDPDGANVMYRFMPSLAVNRNGDLALGYSTSSSTTKPAIKYSGRLAGDPVNVLTQGETTLIQGAGTQVGNCGGSACTRWGDYSAMTLDPDGCTFWYTSQYYKVDGLNHQTHMGSFRFPGCTPVGTGTLQGTVKDGSNRAIVGATVALGSRIATTDSGGNYLFSSLPAGTYPSATASFPGYNTVTVAGIAVPSGSSATRNFVLSAAPLTGCLTDTTQPDFQTGLLTNCDAASSPGDVTLMNPALINQQNATVTSSGFGVNATSWAGQTFTPSATGKLTRVDLDLFCSGCAGTPPNITVSIRATTGATPVPTGADLATATIAGFSSASGGYFTANFASPATLTAGTRYAVIFRPVANPSAGTYAYVCSCVGGAGTSNSNPYANGQFVTSANSGLSWAADTTVGGRDLGFKVYIQGGFAASGTFVSSLKDANPPVGGSAAWGTISWNISTPAQTTLKFQVGASNSANGLFTFVGPDGTAATFFTSGASLAQFNGNRYLKYKALLTSSNSAVTPTLNDVTVCFANVPPATATTLVASAASGTYGGTTTLSATLTSGGSGVSGKSIGFTLNGSAAGSAPTNATGAATLTGVSLAGINAGTYLGAVAASFAGDATYAASSGSSSLTVARASQTIAFGALANRTLGDPDFVVTATATSGLAVSFGAAGNCTIAGNLVHLTAAGSCTITATQAGDTNYNAAPSVPRTFAIASTISSQVVAQALLNGANRLGPPLQHADGGWYFLASDTNCGVPPPSPSQPPPSCSNLFGINGLGLLEAYRHNPSNPTLLVHARAAGDALVAMFVAEDPLARTRPIMQDVEFLGALAQTSGDATYMTVATDWFAVLVAQYPSAASRVDAIFAARDRQGFRSYGAWDAASMVRAARAVGNVGYATATANRIVERELNRVDGGVLFKGWKYTSPAGVPSDDPYGYDFTLLGEGSLLISIFDLPGFTPKVAEYEAFLLAHQDPAGTWDAGDLQMTAYIVKGLIALGDPAANNAIALAESFFANNQQATGGWPYSIAGAQVGPEYTEVDSEVMQALSALYNTPPGSNIAAQPSPLAGLNFSTVTTAGTTTVTAVDPSTTGRVPSGFALAALGYEAATTAGLGQADSDGITVCLWAPTITDPNVFANLRVMHNENGTLVDRTITAPDPLAPNFATRTACARVESLSPFALAVFHDTPPTITAPGKVVVEAAGPSGGLATFDASAIDAVDGAVPVTCVPASGSLFPLGDTIVRCSAENAARMSSSSQITVSVRDTVPPAIVSLTPTVSVIPPTAGMAQVTLAVVVRDLVDQAPRCVVTNVTSNVGDPDHDGPRNWTITGPLTVLVRGGTMSQRDRRFTMTVTCTDDSGNAASEDATVVVSNRR